LLDFAKTFTPQQSDGLPYSTHLQLKGEYFITTNVDVQDGLFNGSTGSLKLIEYGTTVKNKKIPKIAWMDFRNPLVGSAKRTQFKSHQQKKGINVEYTPIERITRNLSKTGRHHGLKVVRTQLSLLAANGRTITKSQGSSIPSVVVSVKGRRKLTREELYVACSRATSLNGLFLNGEFKPPNPPGPNDPVTKELQRLKEHPHQFSIKFLQDYGDAYEKLYFHNVQYFIPHQPDVVADHCAMSSNFIALVEPHLLETDTIGLPGYSCINRSNSSGRNSEGVLLFRKNGKQ
jgi:hypothetical protein